MNFKFYQDTNGSYFCEYSDGNQPADFLQTSCIDIDECDTQHVPMVCLLTLGGIWVMLTGHMTSLTSLVVTVLVKNLLVFVLILVKVTVQANVSLSVTTMRVNGNYVMMAMLVNTTLMVLSLHNALLKLVISVEFHQIVVPFVSVMIVPMLELSLFSQMAKI